MIEIVSLLCEIMVALILMHSLLGKKLVFNKNVILLLVIDCLTFYLINNIESLPISTQFVVYIVFILYIRREIRKYEIKNIVIAFINTFFIAGGLQIIIYNLLGMFKLMDKKHYIVNIVLLLVVIVLTRFFDLKSIINYMTRIKIGLKIVLACGLIITLFILLFKYIDIFSELEIILLAALFVIVVACSYQWKNQLDIIEIKEQQLNWVKQCNDSFEQLITDVRARQHEFNSQIDAICGMQYSCKTYDELVSQINLYASKIVQTNQYNKLLFMECPPIIKGFLYSRFCKASDSNIGIDYHISIDDKLDFSIIFDVTEIAGILFDNACEALEQNKCTPCISVNIEHNEENVEICVKNISPYISYKEISMFTKKGYSTKGDSRGFGLYNVKKIVRKYDGDVMICNEEIKGENWMKIYIKLYL